MKDYPVLRFAEDGRENEYLVEKRDNLVVFAKEGKLHFESSCDSIRTAGNFDQRGVLLPLGIDWTIVEDDEGRTILIGEVR